MTPLSPKACAVLLALCRQRNGRTRFSGNRKHLQAATGLKHGQTVSDALHELAERKLITVKVRTKTNATGACVGKYYIFTVSERELRRQVKLGFFVADKSKNRPTVAATSERISQKLTYGCGDFIADKSKNRLTTKVVSDGVFADAQTQSQMAEEEKESEKTNNQTAEENVKLARAVE